MAWGFNPSGWSTGHVVSVAEFQSIAADIHTWGGNVDGGGYGLTNLANITFASNGYVIGQLGVVVANVAGPDAKTALFLDRLYTSIDDSCDLVWGGNGNGINSGNRTGAIRMIATAGGQSGMSFCCQNSAGDGYSNPIAHMRGDGVIIFYNLRSTDPGAGSKQLWYDASDSNRIKYRP